MLNTITKPLPSGRSSGFAERCKAFSQAKTVRFVAAMMLALSTFVLFAEHGVAKTKRAPEGEDAVRSFLLKETGNSDFLKAKSVDKHLSPASLTKIMTCMIAIESGRLDEAVTIPHEATTVEPTKAGFSTGDRVRLRDLVKAAMVHSSNDAAFAIAVHLGGSLKGFVAKMNARARALGMTHTLFTNPAGYDRGVYAGNRSTARDLVKLTEHAIRYSEFNEIAKLDRVLFRELNTGKQYTLSTHNKLLNHYPYSVGIKTGYTSKAGPCLIARAKRGGKDMLIVLLHAKTDRWSLASTMFDYGFQTATSGLLAQHAVSPVRRQAVPAPAPVERLSDSSDNSAAVPPAEVVYARRAQALKALRRKVERQTAERESSSRKLNKHSADQLSKPHGEGSGNETYSFYETSGVAPNG